MSSDEFGKLVADETEKWGYTSAMKPAGRLPHAGK